MKKIFFILISVIAVVYFAINKVPVNKNFDLIIEKNNNFFIISKKLYPNSAIMQHFTVFYGRIWMGINKKFIQQGDYEIHTYDTIKSVIKKIGLGEVRRYKIFFPEGVTTKYIINEINNSNILSGKISENISEGELMPDTYSITRFEEKTVLISTMKREMDRYLKRQWTKRDKDLPFKTPYEALILASIVEKEVGASYCNQNEYEHIAAVFINRLNKRMRLQSSPTVFYGMKIDGIEHGDVNTINRNPTFNELKIDHPYNTYKKIGLPPTPICNPSKKAIMAVLHPSKIDALFFMSNGKNCHVFTKTFDEHKVVIKEYRRLMKKRI